MPSNAKLLPYRSNVPYLAEYCLTPCDPDFPKRARENNGGFITAGANYGQGSSREHAALAPLQLGVKGVVAVSFARIHKANLINSGIIPMTFTDPEDYKKNDVGDELVILDTLSQIDAAVSGSPLRIENRTKNFTFTVHLDLTDRQAKILKAGGMLNFTKKLQ